MPPTSAPAVDLAIKLVLGSDLTPRQAWEKAGQPNGEAGIQNIRKRVRTERAKAALAGAGDADEEQMAAIWQPRQAQGPCPK